MYQDLAIMALFIFFYSITGGRLARTPINGALVYTAFGLAFGTLGLGLLQLNVGTEGLRILAELALALILFADAANADLRELRRSYRIPLRLLLFGLPLTLLLGFGAGLLVFDGLSWLEIAILATMLAPTDAALGKAVVTDESVPASIRESLNVESGLNDGICVPVLFILLALATNTGTELETSTLALKLLSEEIGIGVVVGAAITLLATQLIKGSTARDWITETWQQLTVPALALSCFALAQWLGGSGFIACFVGGLLFGGLEKKHKHLLLLRAEGSGDTVALIIWVLFGAAVVAQVIGGFSWDVVLYAVLSLTVVRMLPVFLTLAGLQLRPAEKLFMGWFGPRGLASIVFAVIVLDEQLPEGDTIIATVVCTVALSVIFHGISANPLITGLVARLSRAGGTPPAAKKQG